jgi:hypothetical protein
MPWLEASGIFCQCLKIALRHTALHSTTYLHTAVPAEVQGLKSAQWMKNGALAAAAKACREIESVNTVAVWASMGQDRQEYGYGMLC